MNTQIVPEVHKSLIDRLLDCIGTNAPQGKLLELTDIFHQRTDFQDDKPALQSMAILDFLAHQIREGNSDLVSQEMIEKSCIYILTKLLPYDRMIRYRIEERMHHK